MRETVLRLLNEHFDPLDALRWLDEPNPALNGRRPEAVIIEDGYDQILAILRDLSRGGLNVRYPSSGCQCVSITGMTSDPGVKDRKTV